jgi:lipopolysaccharide cholinephosphotransferase
MFFSKLRRNNTTCFERFIPKDLQSHQGIYVDIFPCDNLSDNKILRLMQFLSSKIVIAKSLDQRGYRTNNPMKKLFLLLCRALSSEPFHRFTVSFAAADSEMVHCFFAAASKFRKSTFPRSWLEKSTLLPFEDGTFPVSAYSDELLTSLYGDYRKLPAQQEIEAKIHAVFVDTERSYEHYLEQQKTMELRGYSRSIR